jgi:hypothetical protein
MELTASKPKAHIAPQHVADLLPPASPCEILASERLSLGNFEL